MVGRIVPTRYSPTPTRRYGAKRSSHAKSAHTAEAPQARAVPKSAAMKAGVTAATLMACMAATPCSAGRRPRAFITKAEKAKKTPAPTPQPRAERRVSTKRKPSIIRDAPTSLPGPHPRCRWRRPPARSWRSPWARGPGHAGRRRSGGRCGRPRPRPGRLVELPRVPVLRQRRHRHVRYVLGVDEGLGYAIDRERELAAENWLQEEALAEVLAEKARAHDRPLGVHPLHGQLGAAGFLLTAAGEQHQPPDPALHREFGERTHGVGRPRRRQVRVVCHIHRPHIPQRRRPRGLILPVERRFAGARADPHRQPARLEALHNPAAGLARAANNQRRLRPLRSLRLHSLLLPLNFTRCQLT